MSQVILKSRTNTDARQYADLDAAIAATPSGGRVRVPDDATLTDTLTVPAGVSLWVEPGAKLQSTYSGVAVHLTGQRANSDHRIALVKIGAGDSFWFNTGETTSVGVWVTDSFDCNVRVPECYGFGEAGLKVGGGGIGVAYNTFHIGQFFDNKKGLHLLGYAEGGFSNQNTFIGGRFASSSSSPLEFTGSASIRIDYGCNANLFMNTSLEAGTLHHPVHSILCAGSDNMWVLGRYEEAGPAEFTSQSSYNFLIGGYQMFGQDETTPLGQLSITDDGEANVKFGAYGMQIKSFSESYGAEAAININSVDGNSVHLIAKDSTGAKALAIKGREIQMRDAGGTLRTLAIDSSGRLTLGGTIVGTQS